VRALSPSLALAASLPLKLLEDLNQRNKRRRRQGHTPFQSVEQAGTAALGDDLAGALQIGPDRAGRSGPPAQRHGFHAGEHGLSHRRIGIELGESTWREINNLLCQS
jgi:hypothetical protein